MTTTTTDYAVRYAVAYSASKPAGLAACHAPSLEGTRPRIGVRLVKRAEVLRMWEAAGMYDPETGFARCVTTGEWHPLSTDVSDDRSTHIEFAHVTPMAHGGAYCACNMVPMRGDVNLSDGDTVPTFNFGDPRTVWAHVHPVVQPRVASRL